MSDAWYLSRNGQQYGPYGIEQFRQFAAEGRLSPDDVVANATDQRWMSAREVEGLFPRHSVGVPSPNVPIPPVVAVQANLQDNALTEWDRIREVARWQRWLNIVTAALAIAYILGVLLSREPVLAVPMLLIVLFSTGFAVWCEVRLAAALGWNPWLYGMLMFVPCVGYCVLLYTSWQATRTLQAAGIDVGLFGATLSEQPSQPSQSTGSQDAAALASVNYPGMALVICSCFSAIGPIGLLYENLTSRTPNAIWAVVSVLSIALCIVSAYGGIQFSKLRMYPLAVAASVITIFPISLFCLGAPIGIGIWALVVLNRTEVKRAFRGKEPNETNRLPAQSRPRGRRSPPPQESSFPYALVAALVGALIFVVLVIVYQRNRPAMPMTPEMVREWKQSQSSREAK